jgi:ABC-type uncharacterized transport system involved in gliding motility auxiliary subunit
MSDTPQRQSRTRLPLRTVLTRDAISAIIAIAGAVSVLAGLVLFLFLLELRGSAYTLLSVGGIMLLASLLMSSATVREALIGRRGRYGANTLVMIIAFTSLAILVQTLAVRNSYRWDVTATRQFTLAEQTVKILNNLENPIQATAFFVPNSASQEQYRVPVQDLLSELKHRSGGKFGYRFVDPDIQRSLAKQYNVTQYPTVVFEDQTTGVQQRIAAPFFQERDFASSLLIVTGAQRKLIYYLEGHQEKDLADREPESHKGFGFAAGSLARDNYDVVLYSPYAEESPFIPLTGENAAAAVIIAGPGQDLIAREITALHDYLKRGGRLLLLLEPDSPQSYADFLAPWAIIVNEGFIVDEGNNVAGQTQTPLIRRGQYSKQPPIDAITKPLDQVYFPGATSFQQALPQEEMPSTISVYSIASTSFFSCLAPDAEASDCREGRIGPQFVAVAVAATAPLNEPPDSNATQLTKIVAFGDSDFANNFHHFSLSNSDMLLNSVNWLTEDVALASVRSKPIAFRRLVVTGREMQFIRGLSWFVLPAFMALLAGVAWWRRR